MQFKLKKKLKAMSEGSRSYDFVLIDTPPSLGLLMVNTLTAASGVIIPVQTHYFAMDGVVHLQETIQKVREDINPGLKVLGVVLTMYDRRTLISREVAEKVREEFSERVFTTVIPINVRLAEAPSHHKSIFEYDSDSTGARAYRELAKEILNCPDV
jgi:chromosome partitioning protein